MSAELHALVGAYALDALAEREQDAFEQHLDSCPTCTSELGEFQATAARLAEAVSATPPAGLRVAVLTAVSRTTQQRPTVTVVPVSRWRRYSSTLLAAAAVLAVVALGGLYAGEHNRNSDLQQQQQQVAAIMAAPDVVTSPRDDENAPVRVYSSVSLDKAVVAVDGLPAIDNDHSYEMWAIDADGPHSLGAMPDSSESGTELVDGLGDATAVAVTVERAGGSPTGHPTTPPVETVDLT